MLVVPLSLGASLSHHPSHLLSPSFGAQVLNFAVPDQLLVDRITGRWVHPASGRSYHGAAGVSLGLWLLRLPCLLTVDLRNQLRMSSPHCCLFAHTSCPALHLELVSCINLCFQPCTFASPPCREVCAPQGGGCGRCDRRAAGEAQGGLSCRGEHHIYPLRARCWLDAVCAAGCQPSEARWSQTWRLHPHASATSALQLHPTRTPHVFPFTRRTTTRRRSRAGCLRSMRRPPP